VCFRINPSGSDFSDDRLEQVNQAVQARVIESQVAMMSSTRLHGLYSLRLCILNHTTTWDDVRDTLDAIAKFGLEALSE
jgi:glutamate/tyrosine decarboxylase-like PLP-dependent enzyme